MASAGIDFPPLTSLTARWSHGNGQGLEHLTLEQHGERITATAVVTSGQSDNAFGLWYQLFFDARWRIKAVSLHRTDSRWFVATSPEPGKWCDGDGGPIDAISGCRDLYVPGAAFSLTPIIRRLKLGTGEASELEVLQLSPDTLAPRRLQMTCTRTGAGYHFSNLPADASGKVTVDDLALVLTGPGGIDRIF